MTVRLLPALAIALLGAAAKVQSATVTVDAGVSFQRMEGFGTSSRVFDDPHVYENFNPATSRSATILTTAQQNEVLDRLYVELGLTRVHPVNPDVGTLEGQPYIGVEPVNDNADPYVTDLSKFDSDLTQMTRPLASSPTLIAMESRALLNSASMSIRSRPRTPGFPWRAAAAGSLRSPSPAIPPPPNCTSPSRFRAIS